MVIDQVVERLAAKYPAVSVAKVADVANACYARFEGRPIRDYVALFVERGAGRQLAQMGASVHPNFGEPVIESGDEAFEVAQFCFERTHL